LKLRGVASFVPLILLALIFTVASSVFARRNTNVPEESERFWSFSMRLLVVVCWVYLDRRTRSLSLPYEFDAFVFFAWLIFLPYYLYKSRGARGLLLTTFVYALDAIPNIVAAVIRAMVRVI
jgi:hypothetical protein